jgi:hypothetical protein
MRTQGNYSIPRITNYNTQTTGLQCGFMWPGHELRITYYEAWESLIPRSRSIYNSQHRDRKITLYIELRITIHKLWDYNVASCGLCGSAAVWFCGSVALRLCGSVALRLCGSVALRLCGSAALWLCGSAGLCGALRGSAALLIVIKLYNYIYVIT